jgi:hypothetical protein
MAQLVIWSAVRREWLNCPPDEIVWLDRTLLSAGRDTTLHRSPRCAGLRYVHYRWELFSRDTTHRVYLAPFAAEISADHRGVQTAARHVLPMASAQYETVPVRLDPGAWLISVGKWVLPLCVEERARHRDPPTVPHSHGQARTEEFRQNGSPAGQPSPPQPDAVAKVRAFFERNGTARGAIAYLYQEFILGAVAPQAVPMIDVAIALDLSGEGAVSDYNKELPEFLLANGLIGQADLERAMQTAVINERSGKAAAARQRLRYRPKR